MKERGEGENGTGFIKFTRIFIVGVLRALF